MIGRLLSWLGGGARPSMIDATAVPPGAVLLTGGGEYGFALFGHAARQDSLEAIYRGHALDGADCHLMATLAVERGNSNAYAIGVSICGRKVAQFSREDGKRYRSVIADVASRGPIVCRASIRSGAIPGEDGLRVFLDLAAPARAAPPEPSQGEGRSS